MAQAVGRSKDLVLCLFQLKELKNENLNLTFILFGILKISGTRSHLELVPGIASTNTTFILQCHVRLFIYSTNRF